MHIVCVYGCYAHVYWWCLWVLYTCILIVYMGADITPIYIINMHVHSTDIQNQYTCIYHPIYTINIHVYTTYTYCLCIWVLCTCILMVFMSAIYMYIDCIYGCCIYVNWLCIWVLHAYILSVYGCYIHVYWLCVWVVYTCMLMVCIGAIY
jgi:hypothetical protein